MIITIDGPSGTGKSTVAKRVAESLHFAYFDTGAMYRSFAWVMIHKKIALSDESSIESLLENFIFRVQGEGKEKHYFVAQQDVTKEIRSREVTALVSAVSALPAVRKALWKIQRSFAQQGNAVFEGRDLGTVVFPHAEVKIFLNARPEIRAQRRLDEIKEKNPSEAASMDHQKMLKDIMRRDELDSTRTLAPLKKPEDAFEIDTSDLSIDEVVEAILKYKKGISR